MLRSILLCSCSLHYLFCSMKIFTFFLMLRGMCFGVYTFYFIFQISSTFQLQVINCCIITFHVSVIIVLRCLKKMLDILQGFVKLNRLNAFLSFTNRTAINSRSASSPTTSSTPLQPIRLFHGLQPAKLLSL